MLLGEFLRYIRRDYHQAETAFTEALAVARATGNLSEVARTTGRHICGIAQERLQFDEALRYAEEALVGARQIADPLMESEGLFKIAENLYYLGDTPRAEEQLEVCLAVTRERLDEYHLIPPVLLMAKVQNALGDYQRSQVLYAEALRIGQSQHHPFNIYTIIDALVAVAATRGSFERVAQLRGVADHFIELNRHYRKPYHEREYAPAIASAIAGLGAEAYQAAYAAGRAMTPDEGITAARALISADHETIPADAMP